MTDDHTISDVAVIGGGESRDVRFHVVRAGRVFIGSTPDHQPGQAESGLIASMLLYQPGNSTPVATNFAPLHSSGPSLTYDATDADVSAGGDWICEITNETSLNIRFTTVISLPVPTQTASIDVELLNLLLAEVTSMAAIRLHLESSSAGWAKSRWTWSPALATHLQGQTEYHFHVDDFPKTLFHVPLTGEKIDTVFRLAGLDSDPAYPRVALRTDAPGLGVMLAFQMDGAKLVAMDTGVPDIDLSQLAISLLIGFGGDITIQCTAKATYALVSTLQDVSDQVASNVVGAINEKLGTDPFVQFFGVAQLRGYIESFFVRLMRLDAQAQIQRYRTDGQSLIVEYYSPPPGKPPVGGLVVDTGATMVQIGPT